MLLRNPLGFTWKYALGWRQLDSAGGSMDLDPMQFGNLIHGVLEAALPAIENAGGIGRASANAVSTAVADACTLRKPSDWPSRPYPGRWRPTSARSVMASFRSATQTPCRGIVRGIIHAPSPSLMPGYGYKGASTGWISRVTAARRAWSTTHFIKDLRSLQAADQHPVGDDRQFGHVSRHAGWAALPGAGRCCL